MRRSIPDYCRNCGAAVPRAAAGRCPVCRLEFTPLGGTFLFERGISASTGDVLFDENRAGTRCTGVKSP